MACRSLLDYLLLTYWLLSSLNFIRKSFLTKFRRQGRFLFGMAPICIIHSKHVFVLGIHTPLNGACTSIRHSE